MWYDVLETTPYPTRKIKMRREGPGIMYHARTFPLNRHFDVIINRHVNSGKWASSIAKAIFLSVQILEISILLLLADNIASGLP